MAQRSIIERVAALEPISISGTFSRHAAPGRDALAGGIGGRWGAGFPVIYVGRPQDSVVVEAHRHLVEATGVPAEYVRPRVHYRYSVQVTKVLDLTSSEAQLRVGLDIAAMESDVDDYEACQAVAAAAHQLRLHGVLAPSASGLGQTLALFRQHLPIGEMPTPVGEELWRSLPRDPRTVNEVVRLEDRR